MRLCPAALPRVLASVATHMRGYHALGGEVFGVEGGVAGDAGWQAVEELGEGAQQGCCGPTVAPPQPGAPGQHLRRHIAAPPVPPGTVFQVGVSSRI